MVYFNHLVFYTFIKKDYLRAKWLRAKHKESIISSLNDDLIFEINSPAALKHLSALTEENGSEFRQDFGTFLCCFVKCHFFLDVCQNVLLKMIKVLIFCLA